MTMRTTRSRPASADSLNAGLASTQRCQAAGAFAGNQSFQSRPDYCCLFGDASKPARLLQKRIVNVERSSHMYRYALLMHIMHKSRLRNDADAW